MLNRRYNELEVWIFERIIRRYVPFSVIRWSCSDMSLWQQSWGLRDVLCSHFSVTRCQVWNIIITAIMTEMCPVLCHPLSSSSLHHNGNHDWDVPWYLPQSTRFLKLWESGCALSSVICCENSNQITTVILVEMCPVLCHLLAVFSKFAGAVNLWKSRCALFSVTR